MKIKKLAEWLVNKKRYQIVERPHAIFQSEVIIKEITTKIKKKDQGDDGLREG